MALVCRFTTSVQRVPTSRVPTGKATELSQCFECLTTRHGTLTKVAASERVRSPFTSNHGTQTFSPSSISRRITVRKNFELVICSTRSGRLTCSWNALNRMPIGRSSVQTNALASKTPMVQNSKPSMRSTKPLASLVKLCLLEPYGTRLSNLKLKPAPHTCSTRMQRTKNRIKRTSEPSDHRTFVRKSWSTLQKTKSLSATSPQLPSTSMLIQRARPSITSCSMM